MNNKKIIYILTAAILISFLASIFLISERYKSEETFKNVELILSTQDLETLAYANEKSFEEVLQDFKEAGATSIIFREKTLGDLERSGELLLIKNPGGVYLEILNQDYAEQIEKSIISKKVGRIEIINGKKTIVIPGKIASFYSYEEGYYGLIDSIGIGYSHNQVNAVNKKQMLIIPQVRSWKNYGEESVAFVASELERMNNISTILSNDSSVVGHSGSIDLFLDTVNSEKKIPVGMVEFFNQSGLGTIVYKNDMNAVRIHSISDKEMLNFSESKAIERYLLSVEERNIRGILVKLFNLDNPMNSYDSNINYVETISAEIEAKGFILGKSSVIKHEKANILFYMLVTMGLPAAVWMLFIKLKTPFFGFICALGVTALVGGAFLLNSMLALKIAGLLLVIVYPVLAFISAMEYKGETQKNKLLYVLRDTVVISVITFMGGLMMASLLSFTPFMIKTDQFAGVKVAHLIPLLVVPALLIFWNSNGIKNIKSLLNMAIEYKVVVLGVIGAAALGYYMLRTGNQGAGLVLGIEEKLRGALDYYLGVRPRTKEFLIGYPSLLLLLYLGLNRKSWILLFPAVIGQISLANTYAHIHTPIAISLQRSALGLIAGLALGLVLILCWEILEKVYEKYEKHLN
jgi:hypothetical protein